MWPLRCDAKEAFLRQVEDAIKPFGQFRCYVVKLRLHFRMVPRKGSPAQRSRSPHMPKVPARLSTGHRRIAAAVPKGPWANSAAFPFARWPVLAPRVASTSCPFHREPHPPRPTLLPHSANESAKGGAPTGGSARIPLSCWLPQSCTLLHDRRVPQRFFSY